MRIYVRGSTFVDKLSEPETIKQVLPGVEADLTSIREWRHRWDEVIAEGGKPGGNGMFRWVARLPRAVWNAWTTDDPDVQHNKKKFFAMLDKHKYYAIYNRKWRPD